MPKRVLFLPDNLYYGALKATIEAHEKGTPAVQEKRKKHTKRKRRAARRKAMKKKRNRAEKARKRKEADYD